MKTLFFSFVLLIGLGGFTSLQSVESSPLSSDFVVTNHTNRFIGFNVYESPVFHDYAQRVPIVSIEIAPQQTVTIPANPFNPADGNHYFL